jgi:hypothetical protein
MRRAVDFTGCLLVYSDFRHRLHSIYIYDLHRIASETQANKKATEVTRRLRHMTKRLLMD